MYPTAHARRRSSPLSGHPHPAPVGPLRQVARPRFELQQRPPQALRQGIGQEPDPVALGRGTEIGLTGRHVPRHRHGERHRLEAEAGIEAGPQPVEPQGDQGRDPLGAALGAGQAEIEGAHRAVDPVEGEA